MEVVGIINEELAKFDNMIVRKLSFKKILLG
jgi:hypothetical protein